MIWIDINKETPTNTDDVLIAFIGWDDLYFKVVGYFEVGSFYDAQGDKIKTATHWMQLPNNPV